MCTAVCDGGLFGRTLDLEYSYSEAAVITPRNFEFRFLCGKTLKNHPAIIGIAYVTRNFPLYYDAMNEAGLCIAGLNFPGNATYFKPREDKYNVASFEVIPWVLSKCRSVREAVELLWNTNITGESFSSDLAATPLHWLISDKKESVTVESVESGLMIYDNPYGVLTNNPPFNYHTMYISNFMSLDSFQSKNTLAREVEMSHYSRGMGAIGLPGDYSSSSRFVRAVFAKEHTSDRCAHNINRFFHILDTVTVPKGCVKTDEGKDVMTVYSSCVDMDSLEYHFTTYSNRSPSSLKMSQYDIDTNKLFEMHI